MLIRIKFLLLMISIILLVGLTGCGANLVFPWASTPDKMPVLLTTAPTETATLEVSETSEVTATGEPGSSVPISNPEISLTPSETYTPSLPPSPTNLTPATITLTPTITPTASRTRYPTRTPWPTWTRSPTPTPTITLTPTPPLADASIKKPGLFSRVVSPIQIVADVIPGDDGLVHLDLIGEDGRLINSQLLDYRQYRGLSIAIAPTMDFKISGVAETARLAIYTTDKFSRKVNLASVNLILLSLGENVIYQPNYLVAPYIIRYPIADQIIKGGTLRLDGLVHPVNDQPLNFQLIDEQGNLVGSVQAVIDPPSGDLSHTPFSIDIPYTINAPTPVRFIIFQLSGDRIPGIVALWSMPLNLEP